MANILEDNFTTLGVVETTIAVARFDPDNPRHNRVAEAFAVQGREINSTWMLIWLGVSAEGDDGRMISFYATASDDEKILYVRRGTTHAIDFSRRNG